MTEFKSQVAQSVVFDSARVTALRLHAGVRILALPILR